MRKVHLALQEAEQRGAPPREVERVAVAFDQALAVYEVAQLAAAASRPT